MIYDVEGYIVDRPIEHKPTKKFNTGLFYFDFKPVILHNETLDFETLDFERCQLLSLKPSVLCSDITNFLQDENLKFPLYAKLKLKLEYGRFTLKEIKFEENLNE